MILTTQCLWIRSLHAGSLTLSKTICYDYPIGDSAMVKTKCVYDPPEASDGDRILVTRYWPRPLSKGKVACTDWLRELAPNKELLRDWKKQMVT